MQRIMFLVLSSCSSSSRTFYHSDYDARQCRSSPDLLTDVSKQVGNVSVFISYVVYFMSHVALDHVVVSTAVVVTSDGREGFFQI